MKRLPRPARFSASTVPPWARTIDCKPDARAAGPAVAGRVHPVEALEDQRKRGLRDADAVVLDLHHRPLALPSGQDPDVSALRGVLGGVADEVGQHLVQPRPVAQRHGPALDGVVQVLPGKFQFEPPPGLPRQAGELHRADLQVRAAALGVRQRLQVPDQAGQPRDLLLQALQPLGRGLPHAVDHRLQVRAHRRQRGPKFVGHVAGQPPPERLLGFQRRRQLVDRLHQMVQLAAAGGPLVADLVVAGGDPAGDGGGPDHRPRDAGRQQYAHRQRKQKRDARGDRQRDVEGVQEFKVVFGEEERAVVADHDRAHVFAVIGERQPLGHLFAAGGAAPAAHALGDLVHDAAAQRHVVVLRVPDGPPRSVVHLDDVAVVQRVHARRVHERLVPAGHRVVLGVQPAHDVLDALGLLVGHVPLELPGDQAVGHQRRDAHRQQHHQRDRQRELRAQAEPFFTRHRICTPFRGWSGRRRATWGRPRSSA